MGKIRELRSLEVGFRVYLIITMVISHLFIFFIPTARTFLYTYFQIPSAPTATIFSERWSLEFWMTGSLIILWLVHYSANIMISYYRSSALKVFHIILVSIVLIWFFVMIGFGAYNLHTANDPAFPNNPANDPRLCCVYFAAITTCPNHVSAALCPFAVGPNDLTVDPVFLIEFAFRCGSAVFLIIDLILTAFFVRYTRISLEVERGEQTVTKVIVTEAGEPPLQPLLENQIGNGMDVPLLGKKKRGTRLAPRKKGDKDQ